MKPGSAAAAAFSDDGRSILLQKRTDLLVWGIPGGAIEPGEGGEDAALDLLRHLRFDSPQAMDASLLALCQEMATLSVDKARALGQSIPDAPVAKLLGFLQTELVRQ